VKVGAHPVHPCLIAPTAPQALTPLVEGIIARDLVRFKELMAEGAAVEGAAVTAAAGK